MKKRTPTIGDPELANEMSRFARRCPPFPEAARALVEHARDYAPLELFERLAAEPEKELEAARAWFARARREIPPDATRLRVRPGYSDNLGRFRLESASDDGPWSGAYPSEIERDAKDAKKRATRAGARTRSAPPPAKPAREKPRARFESPAMIAIERELARLERRSDAALLKMPCEAIDAEWRARSWGSRGLVPLWGSLLLRDVVGEARGELLSEARPSLRLFCDPILYCDEEDRCFEMGTWTSRGWTPAGAVRNVVERPYDFDDGYRDARRILRATAGLSPDERLLAGWNAILTRCRKISPASPEFWDRMAALDPRQEAARHLAWFEHALDRAALQPEEGALWFGLFDVPSGWTLRAASRWSARTFDWFYDDRVVEWIEPASGKRLRRTAAFGSPILETGVFGAPLVAGARKLPTVLANLPDAMERLFSLAWAGLMAADVGRRVSTERMLRGGREDRALLVGHPDAGKAILVGTWTRAGWVEK